MWLSENWWLIWMVLASAVMVGAGLLARRSPNKRSSRIVFALFPAFNPELQRRKVTPLSMWLVALGILIVLLAALFMPGFY